jgi:hypothetical protein
MPSDWLNNRSFSSRIWVVAAGWVTGHSAIMLCASGRKIRLSNTIAFELASVFPSCTSIAMVVVPENPPTPVGPGGSTNMPMSIACMKWVVEPLPAAAGTLTQSP